MRCKKHTTDLTSKIGVCASCLRDRLFKLIVAQEEAQSQSQSQSQSLSENTKSIPPFPTSVSPYITRRKSDTSISHIQTSLQKPSYNQRFFNSPQIAISTTGCIGTTSAKNHHNNKKLTKFATFQNLFRSNNNTNIPVSMTSSSPSSATTTRIKNHQQQQQQRCVRNRGMSPVRLSDDDDDDDDDSEDGLSEYESIDTESSSCKQTPMKTPSSVRRGGNKSVSEMIFCLSSPLVRANPNRLWKGKPAVDGTSEARIPVVPKLAYTKSFCANRSRKLADFGRSDPNR